MKPIRKSSIGRARSSERGQTLIFMALVLIPFFIIIMSLVADLGLVYAGHRELQASTDAAALAAGQALPNTTTVTTDAQTYGGISGGKNVYNNIQSITMPTVTPVCLKSITNLPCNASATPPIYNAVKVTQKASVPLNFLKFFSTILGGPPSVQISATSTATERQGAGGPYNVAVIMDTTASMSDSDGDSSNCGTASRLSCGLKGIQTLLLELSPCDPTYACGAVTNGNVAHPLVEVSLFAFPGITTTSVPLEYCGTVAKGVKLTTVPYANPLPATATYQIVPFSSDYRTSNSATTLNAASNLVLAAGGVSTCAGLQDPGGYGTYYAGVLYQAQAALLAQQAARNDNSQNVIVILSDGDATSTKAQMTSPTNNGVYMSYEDECQQAVQAAWTAAANAVGGNTAIYAVSYGSEATGCATDSYSSLATVLMQNITPCQTMQNIASTHGDTTNTNFFSDYTGGGGSGACVSAAQPYSNLQQIFTTITGNMARSQLVPNGTT